MKRIANQDATDVRRESAPRLDVVVDQVVSCLVRVGPRFEITNFIPKLLLMHLSLVTGKGI